MIITGVYIDTMPAVEWTTLEVVSEKWTFQVPGLVSAHPHDIPAAKQALHCVEHAS